MFAAIVRLMESNTRWTVKNFPRIFFDVGSFWVVSYPVYYWDIFCITLYSWKISITLFWLFCNLFKLHPWHCRYPLRVITSSRCFWIFLLRDWLPSKARKLRSILLSTTRWEKREDSYISKEYLCKNECNTRNSTHRTNHTVISEMLFAVWMCGSEWEHGDSSSISTRVL